MFGAPYNVWFVKPDFLLSSFHLNSFAYDLGIFKVYTSKGSGGDDYIQAWNSGRN